MADATNKKERKKRRIPLYPNYPELARSDVSIFPSYTKLGLDYRVICRHRYHFSKVAQRNQFLKELRDFEKFQWNALDGVRVHREFSEGILSHKIPSKRHSNRIIKDEYTSKERMRLEDIISGKVKF